MSRRVLLQALAVASVAVFIAGASQHLAGINNNNGGMIRFLDPSGVVESFSDSGSVNTTGAFFQSLGTNGRTCGSCHQASDAFSITPAHLQARFNGSNGTDPVFRPNDGSNCPTDDVSTVEARRRAYSLLLDRGLIRVSMPIPANADFHLESVDDPYNCATAANMSLYRRPLPSTNLKFNTAIMWDGREPSLQSQAVDATTGHAQGATPTPEQVADIVAFETAMFTAQAMDNKAGSLQGAGAEGGAVAVSQQTFYPGINDVLGADPTGKAFDPKVFTIYDRWTDAPGPARASIARGQAIFNLRPIAISGVKGLNDVLGAPTLNGTCTTCHDSPNAGNHSLRFPIDIGVASFDPEGTQLAYLPQYHFTCDDGSTVTTTDPGRAMITGKCADLGKLKGPILRGLAARAPYFHNGRARSLLDVVEFYDQRFDLKLSKRQKQDLANFLGSL